MHTDKKKGRGFPSFYRTN